MDIIINEIKNNKVNFNCGVETLNDSDEMEVNIKIEFEIANHIEKEKEFFKLGRVAFQLYLPSSTSDEEDHSQDKESEFEKIKASSESFYTCEYLVYFETQETNVDVIRSVIGSHIEPYIRRGVNEFSYNVGIPSLGMQLPYGFLQQSSEEERDHEL